MTEIKKAGKAARGGRLPVKRTINLAQIGDESVRVSRALPAIIGIIVLVALFGKFGVADRLAALSRAESEAARVQASVDAGYAMIDSYAGLEEEYAHYTTSGMTADELSQPDRTAVIDLIGRVLLTGDTARSWDLNGSELRLTVTSSSLQETNELIRRLEQEPLVSFCTITSAETVEVTPAPQPTAAPEEETADIPDMDAIMALLDEYDNAGDTAPNEGSSYVTANIIIYLTSGTEAGE